MRSYFHYEIELITTTKSLTSHFEELFKENTDEFKDSNEFKHQKIKNSGV